MCFWNKQKSCLHRKQPFVGMTGLEPATFGPPDQHSNRTELHPALNSGCKYIAFFIKKQKKYFFSFRRF